MHKPALMALAATAMVAGPTAASDLSAPMSNADVASGRTIIFDGERALDTWRIQNTMSHHECYRAAIRDLEELDTFWFARTGPLAQSATFSSLG